LKTVLWATLTANGNYAQSSPEHPPKQEALDDFAVQARAAGNFIVGRRTFEALQAAAGGSPAALRSLWAMRTPHDPGSAHKKPQGIDIVVVSKSVKDIPGIKVVGSPQEALNYLHERGHATALLSGGAGLHNTFLGQGLVDELILNVAPVLEGKGLNLLLDQGHYQYKDAQLLDFKSLGGGVVQLHFAVGRA
jgi:riboflavin biosynthesis pyrimidine reductase